MEEEPKTLEYKFSNINIERVNNGFILEMDKRHCNASFSDSVYVFNTIEQLSEFINSLK